MNLTEFKKLATKTSENTNNAWGFGGRSINIYTLGEFKYYTGRNCFRHHSEDVSGHFFRDEFASKKRFAELLNEMF
jgi:hypothetical protein